MPLTALAVKQAKPKEKDYKLADGGGMYLLVTKKGGKYWRLKYRFAGKEKVLALGVYPTVTLEEAREARLKAKSYCPTPTPATASAKSRLPTWKPQNTTLKRLPMSGSTTT